MIRVAINGFGRMGRLGLRQAFGWDDIEFVHINEIATDAAGCKRPAVPYCNRASYRLI